MGPIAVDLEPERYLEQGPTTARVAVVDYDATRDVVYAPVQLYADASDYDRGKVFKVGDKAKYRDSFFFHQQNVWAIVNRTIAMLERPRLLGRPIPWASGRGRLLLLPHAGYGRNAFYDRGTGAIHFLYFKGPKSPVFTCLSHDIITHELGHAVLDGLKPYYNEVSSAQTAGFHEYFGDALAIASSLTFRELLEQVVGSAPTEVPTLLGRIGEEFASADGRPCLRDASVRRTMGDVAGNREEHILSQVLSSVFYRFLAALYPAKVEAAVGRSAKEKANGGDAVRGMINAVAQVTNTMLRGLDYCPPVDLTYREYAQAVLRADEVSYPTDETGARQKLKELFIDHGVATAEELEGGRSLRNRDLYPYDVDNLSATTADAYRFLDANRTPLGLPPDANLTVTALYRTRKESPSGYYPPREIVLEFVWTQDVQLISDDLDFDVLQDKWMPLYCGGTLVFDTSGNVLHYVLRGPSEERQKELLEYVAYLVDRGRIGVAGVGGGQTKPIVAYIEKDGRARLQRASALRHEALGVDGGGAAAAASPAGGDVDWTFPNAECVERPLNLSPTDWRRLREKIRGTTASS